MNIVQLICVLHKLIIMNSATLAAQNYVKCKDDMPSWLQFPLTAHLYFIFHVVANLNYQRTSSTSTYPSSASTAIMADSQSSLLVFLSLSEGFCQLEPIETTNTSKYDLLFLYLFRGELLACSRSEPPVMVRRREMG